MTENKGKHMTWCFRVRADIRTGCRLQLTEPEWTISQPDASIALTLKAVDAPTIAAARRISLWGRGFADQEAAEHAARDWTSRLMAAFAAIRLGADFGGRAPQGHISAAALEEMSRNGRRTLQDVHGFSVFECDPAPEFQPIPLYTAVRSCPHAKLEQALGDAITNGGLSEERQVTYDLFAASFGLVSADARFALLMSALETMIATPPRPTASIRHVEHLIALTDSSGLPTAEIASMRGTLNWLKRESIGQAGKKLAATLAGRTYDGKTPEAFFRDAYSTRSKLLHGDPPIPTRREVDRCAAAMEVFVADLLVLHPQ